MVSEVILVNEQDQPIGVMEKMEAHEKGLLHRAFSVFLFNPQGEMLLQQRALDKYHSGGLWTNTCCSHPFPHEQTLAAASRRLMEEMGIATPLEEVFHFTYKSDFDNGLIEHEVDHVFTGTYNGSIKADPAEVHSHCYKTMQQIKLSLQEEPQLYTSWFKIAFPKLESYLAASQQ